MNKIMQDYYPMFEGYQALRNQLMQILEDSDLSFRPSDRNPPLGALCREIGEIEVAYIKSFQTFNSDFSYRQENAESLETSVSSLEKWYAELDSELKTAVSALSDEDIDTKKIKHGGYDFSPNFQLCVYAEALIIFSGKVSVYLRAMDKDRPQQWRDWIG